MSALEQALKHARRSHFEKLESAREYIRPLPEDYLFEIPLLLASGVGRSRMPNFVGPIFSLAHRFGESSSGDNAIRAVKEYLDLFSTEEEIRSAITPSYVWQRSGIQVYKETHEDREWMLRDPNEGDFYLGDWEFIDPPKLSEVTEIHDLLTLIGDPEIRFSGRTPGRLSDAGTSEKLIESLLRNPFRVTASGILLLPSKVKPGDPLPEVLTFNGPIPNPYHSASPRPDALAVTLIREAQEIPLGYILATVARMFTEHVYVTGAKSEILGIHDGGEKPLTLTWPL